MQSTRGGLPARAWLLALSLVQLKKNESQLKGPPYMALYHLRLGFAGVDWTGPRPGEGGASNTPVQLGCSVCATSVQAPGIYFPGEAAYYGFKFMGGCLERAPDSPLAPVLLPSAVDQRRSLPFHYSIGGGVCGDVLCAPLPASISKNKERELAQNPAVLSLENSFVLGCWSPRVSKGKGM